MAAGLRITKARQHDQEWRTTVLSAARRSFPPSGRGRRGGGFEDECEVDSKRTQLRRRQTDAEQRIWYHLRNKQMDGLKFKRQVPRGDFIVDFLCDEAMLIVELDGSQHARRTQEDQMRTDYLMWLGYEVLRFWNADVMTRTASVLETIYGRAIERRQAPSSALRAPSPQGEKDTTATSE